MKRIDSTTNPDLLDVLRALYEGVTRAEAAFTGIQNDPDNDQPSAVQTIMLEAGNHAVSVMQDAIESLESMGYHLGRINDEGKNVFSLAFRRLESGPIMPPKDIQAA